VCDGWAWARARGGVDAQETESDGVEEAAWMVRRWGQRRRKSVPIILSIRYRWVASVIYLPSLWMWYGYVHTVRYVRVRSRGRETSESSNQMHRRVLT
jgi:hypothetical protein